MEVCAPQQSTEDPKLVPCQQSKAAAKNIPYDMLMLLLPKMPVSEDALQKMCNAPKLWIVLEDMPKEEAVSKIHSLEAALSMDGAGGAPKVKEMNIIEAVAWEYNFIEEAETRKHSSSRVPTMGHAVQHQISRRAIKKM
eukprot:11056266-Ditylum_brightwellii.AAC.1